MFDYTLTLGKKTKFRFTLTRWLLLLASVAAICLVVYRLLNGLGATTNLNNDWPWGLWIFCDLFLSALGACGFAVGILTHVFHIKKYYPLARRALLVSLLSYLLIFLILFIEIGRWDNFYMVFVSFAYSSPLYEVFACLVLYFVFQLFEVFEVWAERYRPWVKYILKIIMPLIVLCACVVPFGQEAALGGIYLGMPQKEHVLWSSQFLPWGCLISAFFGGLCYITLEYRLFSPHYRLKTDEKMIRSLLKIVGVVMVIYLVLKIIDLTTRGVIGEAFAGTLEGNMFLLEMGLGVVIPAILCFTPIALKKGGQLLIAACGVIGIILNRFNFIFTGMSGTTPGSYSPSGIEIWTVILLACLTLLCYLFLVENLPVFQSKGDKEFKAVSLRPEGSLPEDELEKAEEIPANL